MEQELACQAIKAGKKPGPRPSATDGPRERFAGQSMLSSWIAALVILIAVAASWYFFPAADIWLPPVSRLSRL